MNNTEEEQVQNLVEIIEKKLGWKPGGEWTHGDFDELSVRIESETKVNLSRNTLKRVWGKMNSTSKPALTTKNTLASFAGFKGWHHYLESTNVQMTQKPANNYPLAPTNIIMALIALGTILFALAKPSYHHLNDNHFNTDDVTFKLKKQVDAVPFSVQFQYDATSIDADTLYIRHEWNPKDILKNDSGTHTVLHFMPNYYTPELYADGKLIAKTSYQALSDGWQFIYPYSSWDPRYYIRLDTMSTSFMQMPPELLSKKGIDISTETHMVGYHFSKPIDVSGNDFTLRTRIKNSLLEGGFTCQECGITLRFEWGSLFVRFTDKSCIKNAMINIDGQKISGINYDLSALGLDMEQWNVVSLSVKNDTLRIYNQEALLHAVACNTVMGDLKSIRYYFRGCGKVDYVRVYDSDGVVKYKEEF